MILSHPVRLSAETFAAWRAERRLFDRRAVPVYVISGIAACVVVLALASGRFDHDPQFMGDAAISIGAFLLIAYAARWIGFPSIGTALEMAMLHILAAITVAFCSAVFASAAAPYRDAMLMQADAWFLGFERDAAVAWLAQWPGVMFSANWIYDSLAVTPMLLAVALLMTRQDRIAWIVLSAMMIVVAVAVCFLPLMPALGSPPYPYRFVEISEGVRDGTLRRFDGAIISGLVTFPSVHAADAVILAWGFFKLGRFALPLVAINVLMILSALLIGGHYLIDLIAGALLAVVSIRASAWLTDRLDRRP